MKHYEHPLKKFEVHRGLYFRIGLVVSLVITFTAFEWTTKKTRFELREPVSLLDDDQTIAFISFPEPKKKEVEKISEPKKKITNIVNTELKIIPDSDPVTNPVAPADTADNTFELNPVDRKDEADTGSEIPFLKVEIMPEFVGGEEALVRFIVNKIKYPKMLLKEDIEGTVHLGITVDENGDISDIKVLHSPHEQFSAEAIRVVKLMPRWKPGIQAGKKVKVSFSLPISFRIKKSF